MNIFIYNRSLRINDITTLIYQMKQFGDVIPIFIFDDIQINPKKNTYFSNTAVKFMCDSLLELADLIKDKGGQLYFFKGDIIKILKSIYDTKEINSIGINYDYTPYARQRSANIQTFCTKHNITFIEKEDYVLFDILDGQTTKEDGAYYKVYTPFYNHCIKNLTVPKPDKFNQFTFTKLKALKDTQYAFNKKDIEMLYKKTNIEVNAGRTNGLNILKHLNNFKDYNKKRDILSYQTTKLSAHNKFGTVSIREVYYAIIKKLNKSSGLIRELIFRDFYYNLYHSVKPDMLNGMIGLENMPFKEKFGHIKWNYDKVLFKKWCTGMLGIPTCDAGMRQLNTTGFMHGRLRMVVASVATKLLLLPWHWCEKYFAQKLTDYDPIQNGAGWGWTCHGVDPTQVLRIFSPKSQSDKFDPECSYILTYIPELAEVPISDIHNWEEKYVNYKNINYPEPVINYKKARLAGLNEFYRVNKFT